MSLLYLMQWRFPVAPEPFSPSPFYHLIVREMMANELPRSGKDGWPVPIYQAVEPMNCGEASLSGLPVGSIPQKLVTMLVKHCLMIPCWLPGYISVVLGARGLENRRTSLGFLGKGKGSALHFVQSCPTLGHGAHPCLQAIEPAFCLKTVSVVTWPARLDTERRDLPTEVVPIYLHLMPPKCVGHQIPSAPSLHG